MTQDELKEVLKLHSRWLDGKSDGIRANLSRIDLSEIDLSEVNLSGADLRRVVLSRAVLSGAVLKKADLRKADLSWAVLNKVDLTEANLDGADLGGAKCIEINLTGADLRRTNLSGTDLNGAILSGADLICVGNMKEIRSLHIDRYPIGFTKDILQIGCQTHPINDWKNFDDKTISEMDVYALEWWQKWKDWIFQAVELSFNEQ